MNSLKIANVIEGLEDTYIREGLTETDRKNIDDALHALCLAMDDSIDDECGKLDFARDLVVILNKTVLKGRMPSGEDLEAIKEIVKILEK